MGFRPYVYRLATSLGLAGWVRNTPEGVVIEIEGEEGALNEFARRLPMEAPPLARILEVRTATGVPNGDSSFTIQHSEGEERPVALVPADVATCAECARELRDAADRRFGYAFTNCTNCGPRFTIVTGLPYDRPKTTMATFTMCEPCRSEYENPLDRRFHAQPNACPECGPRLFWDGEAIPDALGDAARSLARGEVVAVKGLGGYHLACDARNPAAVERLRERKGRGQKPFAVMSRDIDETRRFCKASEEAERLLESPEAPILLLEVLENNDLAPGVAPRLHRFGVMLPYTPLHRLLLDAAPATLVMTSGNLSEEPVIHEDEKARVALGHICDHFLSHDRPIAAPCDDSVVAMLNGRPLPVRRSRGYAPRPVETDVKGPEVLAVGAQAKNAFCLLKDSAAVLSQHIGDLDNVETLDYFGRAIQQFRQLFEIDPKVVAHDLHPEYLSTKFALSLSGVETVGVQHHHAHVASAMVDRGLGGTVIGLAFDGTGYGPDGSIWGAEVLIADLEDYRRAAHLQTIALPGGETSIKKPARMALAYLLAAFGDEGLGVGRRLVPSLSAMEADVVARQFATGLNSAVASSMGRLFDAVSVLLGGSAVATYEGQAAAELEAVAAKFRGTAEPYSWELREDSEGYVLDLVPAVRGVVECVEKGDDPRETAARFHETVARCAAEVCERLSNETGIRDVVMSGGVFQNVLLTRRLLELLEERGLRGYTHERVPPNDGGLCLGQAAIAANRSA